MSRYIDRSLPDHDIRDHVVYRMTLFATMADRMGKNSFSDAFGLTLREYRLLAVMCYMQPVTLSDLVAECFLDKGQVSRIVAKLVSDGLVERRDEAGNNTDRGGLLHSTPKGQEIYISALAHGDRLNRLIMTKLSQEERAALSSALNKLLATARDLHQKKQRGEGPPE